MKRAHPEGELQAPGPAMETKPQPPTPAMQNNNKPAEAEEEFLGPKWMMLKNKSTDKIHLSN